MGIAARSTCAPGPDPQERPAAPLQAGPRPPQGHPQPAVRHRSPCLEVPSPRSPVRRPGLRPRLRRPHHRSASQVVRQGRLRRPRQGPAPLSRDDQAAAAGEPAAPRRAGKPFGPGRVVALRPILSRPDPGGVGLDADISGLDSRGVMLGGDITPRDSRGVISGSDITRRDSGGVRLDSNITPRDSRGVRLGSILTR